IKAMELLGGQPGSPDPLGMNPFGAGGFGIGDPFGNSGMGNPFGGDPAMGAFGSDPGRMGGFGEMGMMMGGEGTFDPAMGSGRRQAAPMRSLEQIREAEELLSNLEHEPRSVLMKLGDGDSHSPQLQMLRQRAETLLSLTAAARANPGSPNAWVPLGEWLLVQEKWDEGQTAYKHALELSPPSSRTMAHIHTRLGEAAMQQGQVDDAQLHFTHAIIADDRVMAAFMGLAAIAEKRGDTHSAIRNLHHVLAWEPNNREARVMLQRIDPEAESAPAPRTEEELAAARELAMNEGRFEEALTIEEERLQLRIEANDLFVDRFSFSGLTKEWVEKHKP